MIDILYSIAGWIIAIFISILVAIFLAFMGVFLITWVADQIKSVRETREKLKHPRQFDITGDWEYEEWERILADPEAMYNG